MLTEKEVEEIPATIDRIKRRYRNMNELDKVAEEMEMEETEEGECPNCGTNTIFQGGCESCPICGWSKCQ